MSNSNVTAPTQFLQTNKEKYAYRLFGKKSKYPLLFSTTLHGYARQLGSSSDQSSVTPENGLGRPVASPWIFDVSCFRP